MILYTDQQQSQPTHQQVVPNEVTCNPTDDTARDDELSNSLASNRRDYPQGAYYSTNPTVKLHNHVAIPPHDANQAPQMQQRLQMHPMLPPMVFERNSMQLQQENAIMNYHNPQMYFPHSQANASFNEQNYQSSQITNERHSATQINQPPVQLFITRKTDVAHAQEATSRLHHKSIPRWDPNKLMSTTKDRNNEASCRVSQCT